MGCAGTGFGDCCFGLLPYTLIPELAPSGFVGLRLGLNHRPFRVHVVPKVRSNLIAPNALTRFWGVVVGGPLM